MSALPNTLSNQMMPHPLTPCVISHNFYLDQIFALEMNALWSQSVA